MKNNIIVYKRSSKIKNVFRNISNNLIILPLIMIALLASILLASFFKIVAMYL